MASRLRYNFIYNAAYQVLLIITPILTTPYLSRILSADGVGTYSYTSAIASYFALFATLGMSQYGVRTLATYTTDRQGRTRTFWSLFFNQAFFSFFALCAYLLYIFFLHPSHGITIASIWILHIVGTMLNISWLLFSMQNFLIPTIRNTIVKITELILIFTLVNTKEDVWKYIAIIAGGFLVSQLSIWPFIIKYVDFYLPNWKEISHHFSQNLLLFIPIIAISLYTTLDKIMLGALTDMTQSGYFEYSERISKIPLSVITALGTVMLPRMTSTFSEGKDREAKYLLSTSFWFMQAAAAAFAFGIASISPEFIPLFLGDNFSDAILTMTMLAFIVPLISATNVLGVQYLVPTKKDRFFRLSVIIGGLTNVCVNLILIPRYGAIGAAVGTLTAEISVFIAQAIFVRKDIPILHYLKISVLPFSIIGLLMAIVVRLTAYVTTTYIHHDLICLILEISAGGLFYIICFFGYVFVRRDPHFFQLIRKIDKK
ncbi:MAG: oligosaccharide flippase family protein [Actinomycetaceae bacterium]|nr:oligosaccharide flippase family protein [Actinomycetaceae bacterium]